MTYSTVFQFINYNQITRSEENLVYFVQHSTARDQEERLGNGCEQELLEIIKVEILFSQLCELM